mgnify:FL=1|jgi:hypothetical protein
MSFWEELESETIKVGHLYVLDSVATFELNPTLKGIRLSAIISLNMGTGLGSKGLDWLVKLADKHNLEITGQIQRLGRKGLNVVQLRTWYQRRGFHVNRHLGFIRKSREG